MSKFFKMLLSFLPQRLPVGMNEFETWAKEIISLVGPIADDESLKFAIASQIMHLSANRSRYSKRTFVMMLEKAAANQVASQVFQDVKIRQQQKAEEAKAAAEKAVLEITTAPENVEPLEQQN